MNAADATVRLRQVRRLALALSALSLAVVCISAYVRLDAAGLGCSDWPACYGRILDGKANLHTGLARILHRLGASAALILAFVLAWQSRQPQPLRPVAGRATALAALMVGLAAIGLWSADPHRAFVTFINILGGLALVSLSWRIVVATAPASPPRTNDPLLVAGIAALVVTMLLGALIGARFAAVSCLTLPACGDTWWPAAGGWAALNPLVIVSAAMSPGDEGGAALHLLHRYVAVAALLLLGGAAHRGLHRPTARRAAMAVLVLLTVEVLLGVLTVAGGFNLWLAVSHSANAAMLMAASLWLFER